MKKNDLYFIAIVSAFFSPFFLSDDVLRVYLEVTRQHALLMSFAKFAVLATLGEVIGLRISQGCYLKKGFGLLPRALFWGFTGVLIKIAFTIFAAGAPSFVDHYLFHSVVASASSKALYAFAISVAMNLMFAPVFMVLHKISDIHIMQTGGTLKGYFSKVDFGKILNEIDWSVMWGFVFVKTLPLFWIPAHTITFLLPGQHQVLFAAILGIVLGVILAIAGMAKTQKQVTA